MKLDSMVGDLKGQSGKDLYIEVEGHTDNVGSKDGNYNLGLERAEAVKRYLVMQHQVPLHKINVISYGEEKPVAPNNTRAGRAQNRRVVVRVLS
jgi:outer membrane protein OmpA-like peptidoglycan-associated protein